MKFANLYWQNVENDNTDMPPLNMGDNLQFMAIDYLYSKFLSTDKIIKLQVSEVSTYCGETLILPINWALFDSHWMLGDRFAISEDIIPVFLAATIESIYYKKTFFNEYNIAYLKRFEPIGCRDEVTYNVLRQYHIKAYVNGCLTSVLPKRSKTQGQNKVFLVDAPLELSEYIPDRLKVHAEVMTQQYYFPEGTDKTLVINKIKKQYGRYADEAALVVTSRLHVASPCMAMGIPVIFAKDQIDGRFSWLDKYIPLYDRKNYGKIDWDPKPVEYEESKELIIGNAIDRIRSIYRIHEQSEKISVYLHDRKADRNYIGFRESIYHNFGKAYRFLEQNVSSRDKFLYSIWGLNQAAENFYDYMCNRYPKAELVNVIDSYKVAEFHGLQIIRPENYVWQNNEYIFVLPVKASNFANHFLMQKGIERRFFVCCGDQFINAGDL